MLAETDLSRPITIQQAVDWVEQEAEKRHVAVKMPENQTEERRGQYHTTILIGVDAPSLETGAFLDLLSEIEGQWNNRDPYPEKFLFLYPAGVPEHVV